MILDLPQNIQNFISGKEYTIDDVGLSNSKILIFDDSVLKVEKYSKDNEETAKMMKWLEGKLPVPKVICYEKNSEFQYLLMSKIKGKMSCNKYYMERPKELIKILASALKMLWSVDISNCPRNCDIDVKLKEANLRVQNNLVDIERVDPKTFKEGRFSSPTSLLNWLVDNKPKKELVLSHGDFCLPNIFINNDKISGFIDLGRIGIGDKWNDIALCYRSLKWNAQGRYGGNGYPKLNPDMLFDALEIEPNYEKIEYYTLLDELF